MTVLEFIRDRYCGQKVKYYVRTRKYQDGRVERELSYTNRRIIPEWSHRDFEDAFYVKDVETFGKVVAVNPFRNKWKLELLDGNTIIMSQYDDYLYCV